MTFGMLLWGVVLCCFINLYSCQITDTPRDQPLIFENGMTRCCQYIDSSLELLHCANKSAFQHFAEATSLSKIASVSYSTPGIFDYGAYSMAVNSYYAELNNYGMRLLTPDDGARYEPRDERWNKVKILSDALDPASGWGKHLEYIVWLDSDLIYMDMGMRIEAITENYKIFDMIFSADPQIENGVVNSGLFIVKNTDWSRQFLAEWWNSYDRILGMDQHIFSKLWESQQPDISKHIKILRPDALNSHFPSWENQHSHNQILHLAGVSGIMRKLAFKKAFTEICAYVSRKRVESIQVVTDETTIHPSVTSNNALPQGHNHVLLPRQLGVNRAFLWDLYVALPRGEVVKQILSEMHGRTGKNISFAEIRKLGRSLADVLQMGFMKEGEETEGDNSVSQSILEGLEWVYVTLRDVTVLQDTVEAKIEGLQLMFDAMFSYLIRLIESDSVAGLKILKEVEPLLDYFMENVHEKWYGPALYYKFKHREFPGIIYESMQMPQEALNAYEVAMVVWWEMHKYRSYGSGNGAVDPYFEGSRILESIASLACSLGHHRRGVDAVKHIIEFYDEIWSRKTRENIPSNVLLMHGNRLAVGLQCAYDMGDIATAKQFADIAILVLSQSTPTAEGMVRLEALKQFVGKFRKSSLSGSPSASTSSGQSPGLDGNSYPSFSIAGSATDRKKYEDDSGGKVPKRMSRRIKKKILQ